MFYNSGRAPEAPGCLLERFVTTTRTNWHYECARKFAAIAALGGTSAARVPDMAVEEHYCRPELPVAHLAGARRSLGFDSHVRSRSKDTISVYYPLRDHLAGFQFRDLELSFAEIEAILGRPLPRSAERPQWWANQMGPGHPQREAWRAAGYDAFLIAGSRKVKFRKTH